MLPPAKGQEITQQNQSILVAGQRLFSSMETFTVSSLALVLTLRKIRLHQLNLTEGEANPVVTPDVILAMFHSNPLAALALAGVSIVPDTSL